MIIIAKLSADDRNTWPEGELQNSRWAQVSVEFNNGVYALRQSYGSLKPTLRSAKVLTPGAVLRKFNDWLSQI